MRSTSDLRELLKFVTEGTLVLFDIDDTLFMSASDYGSQEWLNANTPKKEEVGDEKYQKAFREIRDFKNTNIEPFLQYRLMQSDLLEILKEMRDMGAHIMCLTARNPSDKRVEATERALKELGILEYLSSTTISTDTMKFDKPIRVQNGVIYANNFNAKDEVFTEVMGLLPRQYYNVVYAEDSEEAAKKFQNKHPESKVFHYTKKEFYTSAYSSELVKFQETELKRTKEINKPKIPTNFESRISLLDNKFKKIIEKRNTAANSLLEIS